ncbi:MAG: helix-turn-helix domain-containing protein [Candidatus Paceibacterota bacterium]|jgi:HTH-type transcriptional regulator/antitoxin HigA
MNIKPIKTEKDYERALKRVDAIWDAKANSKEEDELDILVTLIEKYETEHYPIEAPDPIEAIKFRMEQMGMEQKDLALLIGPNRASEILSGKRPLSLNIIRILRDELDIPVDSLVGSI